MVFFDFDHFPLEHISCHSGSCDAQMAPKSYAIDSESHAECWARGVASWLVLNWPMSENVQIWANSWNLAKVNFGKVKMAKVPWPF